MMPPHQRALCPGTARHISHRRCPAVLPEPDRLPRGQAHTTGTDDSTKKELLGLPTRSLPPSDQSLSLPRCEAALRQPVAERCQGAALPMPLQLPLPAGGSALAALLPFLLSPSHGYGTSSRTEVPQRLLEEPGSHQGMGQAALTSSEVSWSTTDYPQPQ